MEILKNTDPVLLVGDSDLITTAAVCLLQAGHELTVVTSDVDEFRSRLKQYPEGKNTGQLVVSAEYGDHQGAKLAIVITHENIDIKQKALKQLMAVIGNDTIIAINAESIGLDDLAKGVDLAAGLIGLNWTEPVHTTFFLEIIATGHNMEAADQISALAKQFWGKDPYIVKNDGIHSRLVSAMAREASFLVDNGYASVDDIDRACRNDAGYYLPFCGNCRYMDLMGTYAYGMVMKDLNPDLSKGTKLPEFMQRILKDGGLGMQNNKGFYNYTSDEVDHWKAIMSKFSYQIQAIIEKYPFNYKK